VEKDAKRDAVQVSDTTMMSKEMKLSPNLKGDKKREEYIQT